MTRSTQEPVTTTTYIKIGDIKGTVVGGDFKDHFELTPGSFEQYDVGTSGLPLGGIAGTLKFCNSSAYNALSAILAKKGDSGKPIDIKVTATTTVAKKEVEKWGLESKQVLLTVCKRRGIDNVSTVDFVLGYTVKSVRDETTYEFDNQKPVKPSHEIDKYEQYD